MAKRKTSGAFWESALSNDLTYRYYFNTLTELAIGMFEWKNLPASIDPRFLELALFTDGMAVWFRDEAMDEYLALRCMIGGQLDYYQIPRIRRAYAANGYQKELDEKNSVIIFNNMLRNNTAYAIEMFAKRLWDLDRTVDVNARAQKTPILIQCDENERLTMKQVYSKYEGNEPFIFGGKGLNPNGIKVIKTDAPYVADKIYDLKTKIWNEALTYLGISNVNITKRERLIQDEVTRNLGGTMASRYSRLNMRQRACKEINEMFGLNISCDYREDFHPELVGEGVFNDGEVHDRSENNM